MDSNCQIPANPDVAGIGIRVSLYGQAILVMFPLLLFPFTPNRFAGYSTSRLARNLFDDISLNLDIVLVTGSALLIAAFVEEQLYDFDLYHGLVVLNLSWLNIFTLIVPIWASAIEKDREAPNIRRQWVAFIAYFTAVGAYGIWLSYRISDFGSIPDCNSFIVWVIAGRSVQATAPALRAFLLTLSCMAVIPLVNLVLLALFLSIVLLVVVLLVVAVGTLVPKLFGGILKLPRLIQRREDSATIRTTSSPEPALPTSAHPPVGIMRLPDFTDDGPNAPAPPLATILLTLNITSTIIIIASTEQLISFNKSVVGEGESDWTFGQILALLLLAPSLWQVVVRIWTAIIGDRDSGTAEPDEERAVGPTPALMIVTALGSGEDTNAHGRTRTESKEDLGFQVAS